MNNKSLIICLLTLCCISCTDWEKEYKKKLTETSAPVKEKIAFINEKHSELEEFVIIDENLNSKTIKEIEDSIPIDRSDFKEKDVNGTYDLIDEYLNKKTFLSDYVVLNVPDSSGCHIDDSIYFDFKTDVKNDVHSYWDYFNNSDILDDIKESNMNSYLEQFEQYIVNPLKTAKYLLVVKDKMLIKPKTYLSMFECGYVYAEVQVFDMVTKKLVDTFNVAAKNSEQVIVSVSSGPFCEGLPVNGDRTVIEDLYDNLYGNSIIKAHQRESTIDSDDIESQGR